MEAPEEGQEEAGLAVAPEGRAVASAEAPVGADLAVLHQEEEEDGIVRLRLIEDTEAAVSDVSSPSYRFLPLLSRQSSFCCDHQVVK